MIPPKCLKNFYIYSSDHRKYLSISNIYLSLGKYYFLLEKPINFPDFYIIWLLSAASEALPYNAPLRGH
jgi:hypothetical protein